MLQKNSISQIKKNENKNGKSMSLPIFLPKKHVYRPEQQDDHSDGEYIKGVVEENVYENTKQIMRDNEINIEEKESDESEESEGSSDKHEKDASSVSTNLNQQNGKYKNDGNEKNDEKNEKDEELESVQSYTDNNWTGANLETLSQWIQISSLQIEILDIAIRYFRMIVRRNVLLGLIFSTASGSLSVFQLNSEYQQVFLNIIFTIMSFSIAIFTGLIKIYQIQERLEEFIQIKQEWIGFSVVITAEVQLPVKQRKKAIDIITKNKNKYLDLLKRDLDIPNFIKGRAYKNLYHDKYKQEYLKNCERHKLLKEIWACADDSYFIKAYDKMENSNILQYEKINDEFTLMNCCCVLSNAILEYFEQMYKYCMNHKDKYIGGKTALSNIILTVIMEEENHHRNKQIIELLNLIQDRYRKINASKYRNISRKENYTDTV